MRIRPVLALVLASLALIAAGCDYPAAHAPASAQAVTAAAVVPAVVEARGALQDALPAPAPSHESATACDRLATEIIVKWEVGSAARYTARYQGVIWPGGASGPTWAVGYDGGMQTRGDIGRDWQTHPQVDALLPTSGVTGTEARDRVRAGEWREVRTPYPLAEHVFVEVSLPAYSDAARRALGDGIDALPAGACAALRDLGYNRGWAMLGARNREKREIRDTCLPAGDTECIAAQLRAMKRLWPDTPGLQNRREDEARLALSDL